MKITINDAFDYMVTHWGQSSERFTDTDIYFESSDVELLAHHLVEIGAIDSSACFAEAAATEKYIEKLAAKFRKLSQATRDKRLRQAFDGVHVFECADCNLTQFANKDNAEVYMDELLDSCWDCGSQKVTHSIMRKPATKQQQNGVSYAYSKNAQMVGGVRRR